MALETIFATNFHGLTQIMSRIRENLCESFP